MKPSPILAASHWKEVKETAFDLAVLPWGATEAHNYHLPYGTDVIEAEQVAAEAARMAAERGATLTVLPVIPFGVNTGQHDIKLNINLNPSTQLKILDDIVAGLERHGIHKLIILNSHGGNDFRPFLRELGLKYPSMWLFQANFYQIAPPDGLFEMPDDHAGEMETSLMLYLKPEWLLPLEEAGDGTAKKSAISAVRQKWGWTEREWSKVTKDTGVGYPKKATREKGETYFKIVTEAVADMFVEVAKTNRSNGYV